MNRLAALIVLLLAAAPACAQSATELKILAVDPPVDALLARQQPFFVRFEVKSAAAVAVSVGGFFKGNAIIENAGTSMPALLPAGGGTGVVKLFYWGEQPTRIDEVRLQIVDTHAGKPDREYAFPVALTWLTDEPPAREPAAWAKKWQDAQPSRTGGANFAPLTGNRLIAIGGGLLLALIATLVWWRRRTKPEASDDGNAR